MNESTSGQDQPSADRSGFTGSANTIITTRFDTPIGSMFACATDSGLCLLLFDDTHDLDKERNRLYRTTGARITPGSNIILEQTIEQVTDYMEGRRREFSVPLRPMGSDFHQSVWRSLQTIPYGNTWSYTEQADALKQPQAVRAVAAANGRNPIAVIIPCHRVIGSDGSLKGYRGGLQKKRWLLDLEMEHAGRPIQKRFF